MPWANVRFPDVAQRRRRRFPLIRSWRVASADVQNLDAGPFCAGEQSDDPERGDVLLLRDVVDGGPDHVWVCGTFEVRDGKITPWRGQCMRSRRDRAVGGLERPGTRGVCL